MTVPFGAQKDRGGLRFVYTAVVAVVLLFAVHVPAGAMDVHPSVLVGTGGISLDILSVNPPIKDVLSSLRNGMQAQIVFTIQVYHQSSGINRLFGDRLVQEVRVTRDAYWDLYGRKYVITAPAHPDIRTDNVDVFVDRFFSLRSFVLPWSFVGVAHRSRSRDGEPGSYLMMQVRVRPMKLVPALAILSFLKLEREITSGWHRIEIPLHGRPER